MKIQSHAQWIPGVYFMQGLPFALVALVSPVLYKEFGLDNAKIALFTSLFALPWVFKFMLAPALERMTSRRNLTLYAQVIIAALILVLALVIYITQNIYVSSVAFLLIALFGAIHDVASDGLYLITLDLHAQSKMIGVRTVFYQLGCLLGQSGVVYFAGMLSWYVLSATVWPITFCVLAGLIFLIAFCNYKLIPATEKIPGWTNLFISYKRVVIEACQIKHLTAVIIFLLLYNLPEAQLLKIMPLFMLDQEHAGGLGFSMDEVGIVSAVSVVSMLVGVTLSGYFLNRFKLKKCLVPFTIATALANLSYLLLLHWLRGVWGASLCIAIGQFFYGLSNGAYMLYLITLFSKGKYSMSLYALGTAIMLFGVVLSGAVCGYMQIVLGYPGFFLWIVSAGLCLVFLAKYNAKRIL